MKFYPIYLNLTECPVLLVGAGAVALTKVAALIECGARLTVVSPEALPEFEQFAAQGKISLEKRGYESTDLDGVRLVIAATDDKDLQLRIAQEARARFLWVNIVDVPPLCDFIAPAIMSKGDLQIAVSTGGAAPAMAKFLRKKLERWVGDEYAEFIRLAQKVRPDILKLPKAERNRLWDRMVNEAFLADLKRDGFDKAEARVREWINGKSSL